MTGSRLHWHTDADIQALRMFSKDLQAGNPHRVLRWRSKEQELIQGLETAQPYGYRFKGLWIWLPSEWLEVIFRHYI